MTDQPDLPTVASQGVDVTELVRQHLDLETQRWEGDDPEIEFLPADGRAFRSMARGRRATWLTRDGAIESTTLRVDVFELPRCALTTPGIYRRDYADITDAVLGWTTRFRELVRALHATEDDTLAMVVWAPVTMLWVPAPQHDPTARLTTISGWVGAVRLEGSRYAAATP